VTIAYPFVEAGRPFAPMARAALCMNVRAVPGDGGTRDRQGPGPARVTWRTPRRAPLWHKA